MAETIQPGECIEKIMNAFAQIGHELTNKQAEQFFQYYEMLVETNKVMNLTAITEFDEVLQKHFVDSVLKSEIFIKEDTNWCWFSRCSVKDYVSRIEGNTTGFSE